MTSKHVFISYIREDVEEVDELEDALVAAGYSVWRDTKDLWPGDDWELKIRQAIQNGSLVFLACFSSKLADRDTSYQYKELVIAADEYRLRPMDTNWLMTVRFDECEIPPFDLGAGRSLERTINRTDLFGKSKTRNVARLVATISRIIDASPGAPSPEVLREVADSKRAEGSLEKLRELLRSPTLLMDFDEYMEGLRAPVLQALRDRERFPMVTRTGNLNADDALKWAERIRDYEAVIAPMLEPMKLVAMYGESGHAQALTQTMRAIAQESTQREGTDFFRVAHEYPAVALIYAATIAAMIKQKYGMVAASVANATVTLPYERGRAPFIATSGVASVAGNWGMVASLLCQADAGATVDRDLAEGLLTRKVGARYTPISDHLYTWLAPLFAAQFGSDEEYAQAFDRAEVLLDAISADASATIPNFYGGRGGYGRYTWRHRHSDRNPESEMLAELETAGRGWTPLLGGLFGSDFDRAKNALEVVVTNAQYVRERRF